jgi:hypothetical protein
VNALLAGRTDPRDDVIPAHGVTGHLLVVDVEALA